MLRILSSSSLVKTYSNTILQREWDDRGYMNYKYIKNKC